MGRAKATLSSPHGRRDRSRLAFALGVDTVAVPAESLQKMHAAAGKGGFAVETAQAMVGPVFTGPTKGHRPGNAKIGSGGAIHPELLFWRVAA